MITARMRLHSRCAVASHLPASRGCPGCLRAFARGFQALEDDTLVFHLVTKEYSREHERCIKWSDPEIGVQWLIKDGIILGEKGRECPTTKRSRNKLQVLGTRTSGYRDECVW